MTPSQEQILTKLAAFPLWIKKERNAIRRLWFAYTKDTYMKLTPEQDILLKSLKKKYFPDAKSAQTKATLLKEVFHPDIIKAFADKDRARMIKVDDKVRRAYKSYGMLKTLPLEFIAT